MLKMTLAAAALTALCGASALAQDYPANTAPSPGIPSSEAVNPAPGATGPYLHDGRMDFYHPMVRERALAARVKSAVAAGQMNASEAMAVDAGLHRVVLEYRQQIARHGDLRDWGRERLNAMMNHLVDHFGVLKS